jgi:hypothetical protein
LRVLQETSGQRAFARSISQQVGNWNVPLKRELVKQRRLINLPLTHHRFGSPAQRTE